MKDLDGLLWVGNRVINLHNVTYVSFSRETRSREFLAYIHFVDETASTISGEDAEKLRVYLGREAMQI